MKIYCTSKNTGPTSSNMGFVYMIYLGTSIKKAEEAVGDFARYQRAESDFPVNLLHLYSAIPKNIVNWELFQYYLADAWWYSIVMFDLEES